jgi:hypothetical protein
MYIGQYGPVDGGGAYMSIYEATRGSTGTLFDPPTFIDVLNAHAFTAPSYISPNGCMMLLFSDRNGANSYDIYQSVKPL